MSKPVWIMCGPEGTWRHLYYRNDRDNIYCAECWRRDAHMEFLTPAALEACGPEGTHVTEEQT